VKKSRLEAFSDGVLAIIITIMVLELKVPHEPSAAALWPLWPTILSYLMSFVFIGIYWNNHHHLWQVVERVNGAVLWANLHLLFWLSLVPFVTAWMGENHFAAAPVALYGVILAGSGCAYYIMTRVLLASHAPDSLLARALGRDFKGGSRCCCTRWPSRWRLPYRGCRGCCTPRSPSSGWCPTAASRSSWPSRR
jgi:uncharacterized membrane protein